MMLEVVHDQKYNTPPQRRPNGQAVIGGTKRGNKKRGLRMHSSSLDEDLECGEDDEEDE
jgi:hypothetical protein